MLLLHFDGCDEQQVAYGESIPARVELSLCNRFAGIRLSAGPTHSGTALSQVSWPEETEGEDRFHPVCRPGIDSRRG